MAPRERAVEVAVGLYAVVEMVRGVVPELLVVAASVVVEIGVSALVIRTVLEAGFLFAALYVFTPIVFPAVVGGRRGAPGFRILVALVTLLFALPSLLALTTF